MSTDATTFVGQVTLTAQADGSFTVTGNLLPVPEPPAPPVPLPEPPTPRAPDFASAPIVASNSIAPKQGGQYCDFARRADPTGAVFKLRTGELLSGVLIQNVYFEGGALLHILSGGFEGLTIDRIKGDNLRRAGLKIEQGKTNRVVVRDVELISAGPVTSGSFIPVGIIVDDGGDDFLFDRVRCSGFGQIRGEDEYWNGDGLTLERGMTNVIIRDTVMSDNTDAGYDLKSPVRFEGVNVAQENCRNFRLRQSSEADTLVSLNPSRRGGNTGACHFWLQPAGEMVLSVGRLVSRGAAPLFLLDKGATGKATVIVESHDIEGPAKLPDGIEFVWKSGAPRVTSEIGER